MATVKYTLKRGGKGPEATIGAGSAIGGGDAIELNIDITKMTKQDVLLGLEALTERVHQDKFPAL